MELAYSLDSKLFRNALSRALTGPTPSPVPTISLPSKISLTSA